MKQFILTAVAAFSIASFTGCTTGNKDGADDDQSSNSSEMQGSGNTISDSSGSQTRELSTGAESSTGGESSQGGPGH